MKLPVERFTEEKELLEEIAAELAKGKIVGWFAGRMEFGPRALGSRSILGDPRDRAMQTKMNLKIKFRESFRPFAPAVLQERAHEYFALRPGQESPYMLHVAPLVEEHRVKLGPTDEQTMTTDPDLRHRVNIVRSTVPAITHVDYSARIQTVDEPRHGRFYRLLRAFEQLTGCPVLVNTSFNVRGEPIVCTPEQACRCFLATEMDVLVLEDFVLRKEKLEQALSAEQRENYLAQFQLD
jgi:carbamoyltransferase